MKLLEVEGARAPVPHSWRRHWLLVLNSHRLICSLGDTRIITKLAQFKTMGLTFFRPELGS